MEMKSKFEVFRERAFRILTENGFDLSGISSCQYELILEAAVDGIVDRVVFWANDWWGSDNFITEIRLRPQDAFICNRMGLFLLNTDGPSDIKFEEHTFPDRKYFSEEVADEANIFYNGKLSFVVNNFIVQEAEATDIFKSSISVTDRRNFRVQELSEIDGDYLILSGSKNIYFSLDLPRKTNWKGSTMRLRLRLGGLLWRNATIIT